MAISFRKPVHRPHNLNEDVETEGETVMRARREHMTALAHAYTLLNLGSGVFVDSVCPADTGGWCAVIKSGRTQQPLGELHISASERVVWKRYSR